LKGESKNAGAPPRQGAGGDGSGPGPIQAAPLRRKALPPAAPGKDTFSQKIPRFDQFR